MDSLLNFLFPNEFLRGLAEDLILVLWGAWVDWWWLVLPPVLFFVALDYWKNYKKEQFVSKIEWVVLELRVPQDIEATPKTMEQVFSSLAATASSPGWKDEAKEGKVPLWLSFEMLGQHKQGVSFFVRIPKEFQRLVETQIYSQYPQAEISLAEDYIKRFSSLPDNYYDIWGAELALAEEAVYPIKTYPFFEEVKEEKRLDPLAPFLEILSHLKEGEEIWLQIVLRGLTKDQSKALKEESKKSINKLIGKKEEEKKPGTFGFAKGLVDETKNVAKKFVADIGPALGAPAGGEEKKEEKKEDRPSLIQFLTPGEKEKVEKAEEKLSKTVFETEIRVVYVAPKSIFDKKSHSSAVKSYFRTFNLAHLNGFKEKDGPKHPFYLKWFFGKNLEFQDINKFFKACAGREIGGPETKDILKKLILNSEELATLYHFPLTKVEAPRLYRLQTKKYEPPPNLPVI
ncbi:MAG: hypothetical protein AB1721_00730 [Patescibacteria group bacterium]